MNSINMRRKNNIHPSLDPFPAAVPLISNTPTRTHTHTHTETHTLTHRSTWDPFAFSFIIFFVHFFPRDVWQAAWPQREKKKWSGSEGETKGETWEERERGKRTRDGERKIQTEKSRREAEMKRAGVLFIHLPLHWSSLWKSKTQRRNREKRRRMCITKPLSSSRYISPSSHSSSPSLALSFPSKLVFKKQSMPGNSNH